MSEQTLYVAEDIPRISEDISNTFVKSEVVTQHQPSTILERTLYGVELRQFD